MSLCSAFARINGEVCVDTGDIRVSEKRLYTGFVYSCSVVTCQYTDIHTNKTINLLGHIDELTPDMYNKLYSALNDIPIKTITNFNVYYGSLCKNNCSSKQIIHNVFSNLGIDESKITVKIIKDNEVYVPE
tara:strand:+ start:394 stop:786 length:393 start_codon:yes stop_codon:yes gene_type:complete